MVSTVPLPRKGTQSLVGGVCKLPACRWLLLGPGFVSSPITGLVGPQASKVQSLEASFEVCVLTDPLLASEADGCVCEVQSLLNP